MRFLNFLSYSGLSDDVNKFRVLKLNLVKENTEYDGIIRNVTETYNIKCNICQIRDDINTELKTIYKGKYKFDFCIDEGKEIENIKMNEKNSKKLKLKLFEQNDKLAKIKKEVESQKPIKTRIS